MRDLDTGEEVGWLPEAWGGLTVSPDGGTAWLEDRSTLTPWDLATGQPRPAPPVIPGPVREFRFDPAGRLVGLGGGHVITWDPLTGKELARERMPGPSWRTGGVVLTAAADRLLFTDPQGWVTAWDVRSGAVARFPPTRLPSPDTPADHQFTPDGRLHVEHHDRTLTVRDPVTGTVVAERPAPAAWSVRKQADELKALAVSPDGRLLAVCGRPTGKGADTRTPVAVLDLADPKAAPVTFAVPYTEATLAFRVGSKRGGGS